MFTKREAKILALLIKNEYISMNLLSSMLSVSTRTIRRDFDFIRDKIKRFDLIISYKKGSGYRLNRSNQKLKPLLKYINLNSINKLERKIFLDILNEKYDYYDFENKYMYSESTIKSKIGDLRFALDKYDLCIKKEPYSHIKIHGEEKNIRKFIFDNYFCFTNNVLNGCFLNEVDENFIEKIKNALIELLIEDNKFLSDADFSHLLAIIVISIYRNRYKNMNGSEINSDCFQIDSNCNDLTRKIACRINLEFNIQLSEYEISYINENLVFGEESKTILSKIDELINDTISKLNESYNYYNLSDELIEALKTHINFLIKRSIKNIVVQNPLLGDIKQKYMIEFDDALFISQAISKEFNVNLTEEEVGYLALYLGAIKGVKTKNKKAILICNYGLGISQIIKMTIEKEVRGVEIIGVYSSAYLEKAMTLKPDFVISTISLNNYKYDAPLIESNQLLIDLDHFNSNILKKIGLEYLFEHKLFFQLNVDSKDEFFEEAFSLISRKIKVSSKLLNSVLERENFSNTLVGNMVAIPHTFKPGNFNSFIAIFRNSKSIDWGKGGAKLIFMIVINEKDKIFIDSLSVLYEFILDSKNVNMMLELSSIEEIVKEII